MFEDLKPGTNVKCTVTATPKTQGGILTLRRLQKLNTEMQQELNKAYTYRRHTTIVGIRAGKRWAQRPRIPMRVFGQAGETWTMKWRPQLAADLASVAQYVTVEPIAD
ncbi:MAG: hypothetical protein D8M59_07175 [Planctomycetes bacterium]|nr:hypothetical protein [Planctomycetota bacterium]NOG53822.1 hypothetical protein [Planctomycetota bacterium]